MVSRALQNEVCYGLRMLLSMVPSLGASTEQRADYHFFKGEFFDLVAAFEPSIAAQATHIADKARREAHAINLDY